MNPTSSRRQSSLGCFALALFGAFIGFASVTPAQSPNQEQPSAKDQSATQNQQAPPGKSDKKDKKSSDPATVKLLGNVPVNGKASGGILRHKGWKAEKIDLPPLASGANGSVIAPAEVEIE